MKKILIIVASLFYVVVSVCKLTLLVLLFRTRGKGVAFLLATPSHSNLGDQAIACAERQFLSDQFRSLAVIETRYINKRILDYELWLLRKIVRSNDIIFGHGGGNMGDQYPQEEASRLAIISTFTNNRIIIFPQTIYFKKTKEAQRMLSKAKKVYSGHRDLILVAREKKSYKDLVKQFPSNNIHLTPDIVLYLNKQEPQHMRKGAMTCLRNDVEVNPGRGSVEDIKNVLKSYFSEVRESDTISDKRIILTDRARLSELNKKWNEFKQSEVVVTDRLHGMVFAAITGTPCVVFSNYNHKVYGTYEWIKDLPNIYFCEHKSELNDAIKAVLSQPPKPVPAFTKHWQRLVKEIR